MARSLLQAAAPVLVGMLSSRLTGPASAPALRSLTQRGAATPGTMAATAIGSIVSEAVLNRALRDRRGAGASILRYAAPVVIGAIASRMLTRNRTAMNPA
jgi:uncharacterized protein (DUF2342 family)